MGKTIRGLNKKQREKFGKSRKNRQEKRRVQIDRTQPNNNKKQDDSENL